MIFYYLAHRRYHLNFYKPNALALTDDWQNDILCIESDENRGIRYLYTLDESKSFLEKSIFNSLVKAQYKLEIPEKDKQTLNK